MERNADTLSQSGLCGAIGMIFVTVGTTKFDSLIIMIDRAIREGRLKDEVIAQIGTGEYIPTHMVSFRFRDSLWQLFKRADLVVSHGGSATTFECLTLKKKLIVVPNPDVRGDHQQDIAKKLSRDGYLLCCMFPGQIVEYIKKAKVFEFRDYVSPKCTIADKILEFLGD